MSDCYCTNCGADLGDQEGFDPDKGFWRCKECDQELYGDDSIDDPSNRFPGVVWHCDGCDAVLNNQFGFDDWLPSFICEECGTLNYINQSEIDGEAPESDWGQLDSDCEIEFDDESSEPVEVPAENGSHNSREEDGPGEDEDAAFRSKPNKPSAAKGSAEDERSLFVPVVLICSALTLLLSYSLINFPEETQDLLKQAFDLLAALVALLAKTVSHLAASIFEYIQQ